MIPVSWSEHKEEQEILHQKEYHWCCMLFPPRHNLLVHETLMHVGVMILIVNRTRSTMQLSCLSLKQWWSKDPLKDQSSYSVEYDQLESKPGLELWVIPFTLLASFNQWWSINWLWSLDLFCHCKPRPIAWGILASIVKYLLCRVN